MQNKKNVWIIFYISSRLNYRIYSEHSQYKFVVFSEPRQGKGVIDTNANNIFDNVSRRAVEKGISINSLEENFKNDIDNASSIKERLQTLKEFHDNRIYTVLFMSPIFPYITNFKEIIETSKQYVDEYWFENLNLRGDYKTKILFYIQEKYPELIDKYNDIYIRGNKQYWYDLSKEIQAYCENKNVKYINYFYHEELVKNKKKQI